MQGRTLQECVKEKIEFYHKYDNPSPRKDEEPLADDATVLERVKKAGYSFYSGVTTMFSKAVDAINGDYHSEGGKQRATDYENLIADLSEEDLYKKLCEDLFKPSGQGDLETSSRLRLRLTQALCIFKELDEKTIEADINRRVLDANRNRQKIHYDSLATQIFLQAFLKACPTQEHSASTLTYS